MRGGRVASAVGRHSIRDICEGAERMEIGGGRGSESGDLESLPLACLSIIVKCDNHDDRDLPQNRRRMTPCEKSVNKSNITERPRLRKNFVSIFAPLFTYTLAQSIGSQLVFWASSSRVVM